MFLAALAVPGRAYRRYRLLPHQLPIAAALAATVARHALWPPELAAARRWPAAGHRWR